jgi:hypothetical protein|nr:MAG TPA: hypothetical protein [Caudoviricetes sp.]
MTDPKDWNIPDMVAVVIADDADAESLTRALQDVKNGNYARQTAIPTETS